MVSGAVLYDLMVFSEECVSGEVTSTEIPILCTLDGTGRAEIAFTGTLDVLEGVSLGTHEEAAYTVTVEIL